MFRFMERNTYRVWVRFSKSDLDVDFIASDIFAEYPHFTLIIQSIYNRALWIIIATEVHNNIHSLIRSNTQFNKTVLVLLSVISETYSKDFDLQTEIL